MSLYRRWSHDALNAAVNAGWAKICSAGMIGPNSRRGRRFRHLGAGSAIGFPPGDIFGEHWISVGSQTLVCAHVAISAGIPGLNLDPRGPVVVSIGDRCSIGRSSFVIGLSSIEIEDDVTIAPGVYITDHNHSYEDTTRPIGRQWPSEGPVRIGAGSWLGTGVVVLPGTNIGRNVTVAAGSVVRGSVPDRCVVAGAPARVVRRHRPGSGWSPPLPARLVRAPEGWDDL